MRTTIIRVCAALGSSAGACLGGPGGAELGRQANAVPRADQLSAYHERFASEPHEAGTPGDRAVIDELARLFASFGLEVEVQEFDAYLGTPVSARVAIVAPDEIELSIRERPVAGDPFSERADLRPGFNAYSGSGDVRGPVVYANYGRLEDYERLDRLGVDLRGKVVLARYGGNYRGYKVKYAEARGAAAVLMYTDPADSGYAKGIMYPEGGYANDSYVQRGSVKTLDYLGDPLTPGWAAEPGAERLDPDAVALPRIPAQPIPWASAHQIMERMAGPAVPPGWQGGLPLAYRLEGGTDLVVRVAVEQERGLVRTANVIGTLVGESEPERMVYVGCHHDAWGFGAVDATAGLICLVESARSFGELAARGVRPRRTIKFCAWGAEEHGIIGSVEYVEANAEAIGADAVAYLNLDAAAAGPRFGSSASPSLRTVIAEAAGTVAQAGAPGETVLSAWLARGEDPSVPGSPRFGDLGGGSDHVGFLCYSCVPSASLGAGGAPGVSYHSVYDNLSWYRRVVGADYASALMVTRMTNAVVARLADEPVIPLDPGRYEPEIARHLRAIRDLAGGTEVAPDRRAIWSGVLGMLDVVARPTGYGASLSALGDGVVGSGAVVSSEDVARVNELLLAIERGWCADGFATGMRFFRSGFAASDPTSGYAAWMLPGLRRALREKDPALLMSQAAAVTEWKQGAIDGLVELRRALEPAGATNSPGPLGGPGRVDP